MEKGDRIIINGIDTPYIIGDEIQFDGLKYIINNGIGLKWANRDKVKTIGSNGDTIVPVDDTGAIIKIQNKKYDYNHIDDVDWGCSPHHRVWKFSYRDGSIDDGEWIVKLILDLNIDDKRIKMINDYRYRWVRLYNFG